MVFLSRGGSDSAVLIQAGLPEPVMQCVVSRETCFQGGFPKPGL